MNEATARIKINSLLEKAGWRFFPDGDKLAIVKFEKVVLAISGSFSRP